VTHLRQGILRWEIVLALAACLLCKALHAQAMYHATQMSQWCELHLRACWLICVKRLA
jgi:hypothetical protein